MEIRLVKPPRTYSLMTRAAEGDRFSVATGGGSEDGFYQPLIRLSDTQLSIEILGGEDMIKSLGDILDLAHAQRVFHTLVLAHFSANPDKFMEWLEEQRRMAFRAGQETKIAAIKAVLNIAA